VVREGSFDTRSAAVVHEEVEPLEPAVPGGREFARIVTYRPRRVQIDASCASTCLLVLTDLFDPGWRVRVDAREARIVRANVFGRGVRLARGRHEVTFMYAPTSFRVGLLLSAASAVVALGTAIACAGRRPDRSAPAGNPRAPSEHRATA
jgi:uncharacterized membrane protein YfhO